MVDIHERLFLPALRATMGDWVYYISFMSMEDIATRVSVVDDIHSSESLKEWLQRGLTNNSVKITEYLLGPRTETIQRDCGRDLWRLSQLARDIRDGTRFCRGAGKH